MINKTQKIKNYNCNRFDINWSYQFQENNGLCERPVAF